MSLFSLQNEKIRLSMKSDGTGLALIDLTRGVSWRAEDGWITSAGAQAHAPYAGGMARKDGDSLIAEYGLPGGMARFTFTLLGDGVEATLDVSAKDAPAVVMPAFHPEGEQPQFIIPRYQGLLFSANGKEMPEETHACQLNMLAVMAREGGLLATQETPANWFIVMGESATTGPYAFLEQQRCPVHGWYTRHMRLYPTDASITAIAKRYRRRIMERGEFITWQEKIERKPILSKLFGSLFAFIGYNAADDIDYADSARRLRDYGFETVMYYPVRMCQRTLNFKMGGDNPIWLSDNEIAHIKAVDGALVAPWGWEIEWLDDGSEEAHRGFAHDAEGKLIPHWRIEDQQWNLVCTPYQTEQMKKRFAGDMRAMDWIHYDVNAHRKGIDCFRRDHKLHSGRPIGAREGVENSRILLGPETNGNRIVSSENFADHYTSVYDVGSSAKLHASFSNTRLIPVPFSSLVYHDSCLHHWWELYTYNALPGFEDCPPIEEQPETMTGAGNAEKKAVTDALYGGAPLVMPFGKQYYWLDVETRKTASFVIHLDDDEVQRVLPLALRVARLHKKIGPCEMTSFAFLTEDFTIQTTTFSNGTRIVANVSDKPRDTEYGLLGAYEWIEVNSTR